jgi:plasmid stabilization system protein ParE
MSRELIFLPEVSRDFIEAFSYYESLSPGRGGARFEAAFRQAIQEVERGRITHLRVFEHFHRVFLKRFPYNLYYRLAGNRAVITGVLYARFEPRKIEGTLKQRV